MPGPMDLLRGLAGPVPQGIFALLGAGEQRGLEEEQFAANQALINELRRGYRDLQIGGQDILQGQQPLEHTQRFGDFDRLMSQLGLLQENVQGGFADRTRGGLQFLDESFGDLRGGYDTRTRDLMGAFANLEGQTETGYREREARAQELLTGLGTQQRTDIGERMDVREAERRQDLGRRGLGATSAVSGAVADVDRERSAELRRMEEGLARERIGVESELSGQRMSAMERLGMLRSGLSERLTGGGLEFGERAAGARFGAMAGLTGEELASEAQLGQLRFGADQQLSGGLADMLARHRGEDLSTFLGTEADQLGFLERINIPYTPRDTIFNMLSSAGRGQSRAPQGPSAWDQMAGPVAGAATTAVASSLLGAGTGAAATGSGLGWLGFLSMLSDRNLKENFNEVSEEEILEGVEALPISRWNYKDGMALMVDGVSKREHIGPMAQDFKDAFDLGDGRTIALVDAFGVALTAIKALTKRVRELEGRLS